MFHRAARALANLAADDNGNNAALGQEAGALEALVHLLRSSQDGVRKAAAGALMNLCFNHRNWEAIAAAGGVEALVALANSCSRASPSLQEKAASALWGLSLSETNSIAIVREGGIASLIALARSKAKNVQKPVAGALWSLAFQPSNALQILMNGGAHDLFYLGYSSISRLARFMYALALSYMFDGRMDEFVLAMASSKSNLIIRNTCRVRRLAMNYIKDFILASYDPQAFSAATTSSAPASLTKVAESVRILEAGHLCCSGAVIGRFILMLRNPSDELKMCAAFALLQFTLPGGQFAFHNSTLLLNSGATRAVRAAAAAATAPCEAKIFAKIVLRNLEHHQKETSV